MALFFAIGGGTALATHPGGLNTISSEDIINGEVKSVDMHANSVSSSNIIDTSVATADIANAAGNSGKILTLHALLGQDGPEGAPVDRLIEDSTCPAPGWPVDRQDGS